MDQTFLDLTIVMVIAAVLGIIFRVLKQPVVLAYIITGVIVGPLNAFNIQGHELFHSLSQIGITLLLFLLGLELKIKELRLVGKVSLVTGIGQIVFTSLIGFFICIFLGFDTLTSLYLSIALTFSSTIIIVKLLSDKKDLNSLYGKISVGFLLVQDFIAILALIFLSSLQNAQGAGLPFAEIIFLLLKAAFLFALVYFLSQTIFPAIIKHISKSQEILLLFCLAWAFGLSALVSADFIGFSIEIGGFLAGLALANSTESLQIIAKVRSLRDFFIVLFFVVLGMSLNLESFGSIIIPGILLSLFVLVGNPLIVMALMGILGYKRRTGFLCGLAVAQISEFSLIVIFLGNQIGHIPDEIVSLITFVGIVTFTLSTYAIANSHKLYELIKNYIKFFEKKNVREKNVNFTKEFDKHIVIIGLHRIGMDILRNLEINKEDLVLVDFNPDIVHKLEDQGYNVVFGDIADSDIYEKLFLDKARLVISTIPDIEDNIILLKHIKTHYPEANVLLTAHNNEDIEYLYKEGADIVIAPLKVTGRIIGNRINSGDIAELKNLNRSDV